MARGLARDLAHHDRVQVQVAQQAVIVADRARRQLDALGHERAHQLERGRCRIDRTRLAFPSAEA